MLVLFILKGEIIMWKWVLIIVACIYVIPIIVDTIKAKDSKKCFENLSKKEKIIVVVILILIIIVMPSYLVGKNMILKNKVRETIERTAIYNYVSSYETSGFKNSTINLNVNDEFGNLDDNTKLKYAKEIYSSVDTAIYIYGGIDKDDLPQLVRDHKVIIKAREGEYKFEYESLEKPDGKEVKEAKDDSLISNATTKSYNNDKTLRSGQNIILSKNTPVCSSKDNLDKMLSFINANNNEAVNNMILKGQATILSKGTQVNVIDSGILVTEIETLSGESWFAPREVIQDAL